MLTDATTAAVPEADPDATAAPDPQATADAPGRADALGTVIAGKYTLTEPLGEGGMGTVYLARQSEPVRRFVAVKLIKAGLDSKAVLARFEAERQALAMMDHPNIARVLDAGATADGRPFFVMELVPGTPITTYCDTHRLTTRQRLELFVPVCKAIQHAHQKGIIHRDIKPSNVLVVSVDDRPVPKVIDFGLAKATGQPLTDSSLETRVGALIGTPEYMSPEQARFDGGDVDTRSDVYALGVLLYELLAGSTPVDSKSLARAAILEVLRIVREVEPPRPSDRLGAAEALPSIAANRNAEPKSLCRLLRGELDWVALKALEKDRARRYDTVNALARDIERYLADEVVEARPPSAGYRLRKLVRRNKGRAAAVALVLAALVAGLAGTTWGLLRARAAEGDALEHAKIAETERDNALAAKEAEAEQRKAAELANARARKALGSFTNDLMETLLGSKATLTEPEKAVLQNALKQWEVFASAEGDTPAARDARAEGLFRVAGVQSKLGLAADAVNNYRAAITLGEQLVAETPDVAQYRVNMAGSHNNLGLLLKDGGDWAGAERAYRAALALQERLVADSPGVPGYRADLASSHNNLGGLLADGGDRAGAKRAYRAALALREKLVADEPDVPEYRAYLANHYDNLGGLLADGGDRAGAERAYRAALALREKLVADEPDVPEYRNDLAGCHNRLGGLLADGGDRAGAERAYRAALALREKLAAEAPGVPKYRNDLASCHDRLGGLLADGGDRAGAEREYRAALALRVKLAEESPGVPAYQVSLGGSYCNFGNLLCEGPAPADSLDWYGKAIRTLTPVHTNSPELVTARQFLRNSHWGRARANDALKHWEDAIADWDRAIELSPADARAGKRASRATDYLQVGRLAEAIAEAADLTKSDDWDDTYLYNFACIYAVAGDKINGKREEYAVRAVELLRRAVAKGYKNVAHIAKDTDLDPLRRRADFQALVADLAKKFPPPVELAPPPRPAK